MQKKFSQFVQIISEDPAVENVAGFDRRWRRRTARRRDQHRQRLHPAEAARAQRDGLSTDDVIDRLRAQAGQRAGRAHVSARRGGTSAPAGARAMATYQYTHPGRHAGRSRTNGCRRSRDALQNVPELEDVNSDREDQGLEVDLKIDRATAARLGV